MLPVDSYLSPNRDPVIDNKDSVIRYLVLYLIPEDDHYSSCFIRDYQQHPFGKRFILSNGTLTTHSLTNSIFSNLSNTKGWYLNCYWRGYH